LPSTQITKKNKPEKPYAEFPLFAHANKQWAKKVKGKLWYFGKWDAPDAALKLYLDQIDAIRAGRDPKTQADDGQLTVADAVNLYLASSEQRVERGEITRLHFEATLKSCRRVVEHFGRRVSADTLKAADFAKYRSTFPPNWSAASVSLHIAHVRAAFRWMAETELISGVPNFGPSFKKPGTRAKRIELAKRQAEHGRRDFEAIEIRSMLEHSDGWLQACILLGINAGFGNQDCSGLRISHVDKETGWYDLRRRKTGIPRRAFMWKETREAISAAIVQRKPAVDPRDDELCFTTRRGCRLVNECVSSKGTTSVSDNVSTAFSKLLTKLEMKRPGRNFYSLRRTFETVASGTKDQPAIDLIMGHHDDSMAAVYRQGLDDQRLIDVAEHVRQWLFCKAGDSK